MTETLVERLRGHSPGPWHAWMRGKTICVLGKEKDHRKPIVTWGGFDGCGRTLAKQEANARLIAEAPTLLAKVSSLQSEIDELREALRSIANAMRLGAETDILAWISLANACQETARATLTRSASGEGKE